jgi:protein-L-isoaspartate(D-aspartate) O-methyltransferase
MPFDEQLLIAFESVPRELFISPALRAYAYKDQPLPTLRGQSISQPTTIMMMLQALELQEGDKVFEVGAGVGYQAALISRLIGENGTLISVDVVPELVQQAQKNMTQLAIANVTIMEMDGSEGYPPEAPYDKIIITAACPAIPPPLINQLREGGIIIAPVGDLESQTMIKGVKTGERLAMEFLGLFTFVPMRGKHGFKETELFND